MIKLKAVGISLNYGSSKVLDKVTFSVNQGEFFSIIGPNGSGKTTLLKTLSHILIPHSGAIELEGKSIAKMSRKEISKKIAVVPQQEDTGSLFTVEEMVLMGRSPHLNILGVETKKDYELAYRAMEFTDLTGLAKRKMNEISGGERQRVLIARAVCQEAEVILLDEPTSALDYAHQIQIMDLMENFRNQNQATIIMVSHDLNLAAMYSDRMLVMKNGLVLKIGNPQEVLEKGNLLSAFDCNMHVSQNPFSSVPRVMPVPKKFQ